MKTFIKQNWVALLSLSVALVGGIPEIIEVVKFFRQKLIFKYSLVGIINGNFLDQSNKQCLMVLLSGTVLNAGDKPLVPNYYDLEAKINNKWIRFDHRLIPTNAIFKSDVQDIQLDKPWEHDLQKLKKPIIERDPAYGHLMFISKTLKKEDVINNKTKLKLICTDIFYKKYHCEFSIIDNLTKNGISYPKHGLTIQPKN